MFGLDSSKHVMSSTPVGFHAGFSIVCQPIKIGVLPTPTTLPHNTSAIRQSKPGNKTYILQNKAVSTTNNLRRTSFRTVMFLRTIGSRFSIQRGSLLLRRIPVRCITGVQQSPFIENGDTSVVGRIVYRFCFCSKPEVRR